MHYSIKNLSVEDLVTYQIQIFFSEIIDHMNLDKIANKEIINEINDSVNSFQITEKLLPLIKLCEPKVKSKKSII